MLTGALIILAELIVLFRLALPDFLAWAERRADDVYGREDAFDRIAHGDCFQATILNNFHGWSDTDA